jgi:hypothetical protein
LAGHWQPQQRQKLQELAQRSGKHGRKGKSQTLPQQEASATKMKWFGTLASCLANGTDMDYILLVEALFREAVSKIDDTFGENSAL